MLKKNTGKKRKKFLNPILGENVVLTLDGNSLNVAHASRKIALFG